MIKHDIKLADPIPFKKSYRRIPAHLYDEIRAHLKEMLDLGAIRKSQSPWSSAIVLVRKKNDGKLRFCIDLRKLNMRTIKDKYSLPRIEHQLGTINWCRMVGVVLYQKDAEGKLKAIAYSSRSLTKSERNYPAHKLEFLALKWEVTDKFKEYLYGTSSFEVFTDKNPSHMSLLKPSLMLPPKGGWLP